MIVSEIGVGGKGGLGKKGRGRVQAGKMEWMIARRIE